MKRNELIDFLLGELPQEQASAISERLALDESAARDSARYSEALSILREAAAEATWEAAPPRGRLLQLGLRLGVAAAAVLLVAIGLFWANHNGDAPSRVFDPGSAFGALLPEELGADGSTTPPSVDSGGGTGSGYVLRQGDVAISSLGAQATHDLTPGAEILENSEITCAAEGGARIDLPHGGMLFLRPLSTIQLRSRRDGRVALRLLAGDVATVANGKPIHVSVEGTDLLLTQTDGAALLRHQPGDAICLRGTLELHVEDGSRWRVPEGERLPASCARTPESTFTTVADLQLDWYFTLQYGECCVRDIVWEREGESAPITHGPGSLVYLCAQPTRSGTFEVRLGDGPGRAFELVRGKRFELRVAIASLGTGTRLHVTPGFNVKQARLFSPAR